MSLAVCTTCKHADSCTFPRNQVIIQCEEYECADSRLTTQLSEKKQRTERASAAAGVSSES